MIDFQQFFSLILFYDTMRANKLVFTIFSVIIIKEISENLCFVNFAIPVVESFFKLKLRDEFRESFRKIAACFYSELRELVYSNLFLSGFTCCNSLLKKTRIFVC